MKVPLHTASVWKLSFQCSELTPDTVLRIMGNTSQFGGTTGTAQQVFIPPKELESWTPPTGNVPCHLGVEGAQRLPLPAVWDTEKVRAGVKGQ